jgi:hypothetical protein
MSILHAFILLAVIVWGIGALLALMEKVASHIVTVLLFVGLILWGVGVLVS